MNKTARVLYILSAFAIGYWGLFRSPGIRHLLTPRYGEEQALSGDAFKIISLLRQYGITAFALSEDAVAKEEYFRLSEAAYPIRLQPDAAFVISIGERPGAKCKELGKGGHYILYDCSSR